MKEYCGEEGISEVVGIMLLVGLTVLGVALVGIVFLSDSWPDEIPHALIVAGNESGSLALVHEGGDPLREGDYQIYVDIGNGLVKSTDHFRGHESGQLWSIGGTLVYAGPGTPKRVVVTAGSGGSETILAEPDFVGGKTAGFSPDPVEPGVTTGSGGGGDASPIHIVSPAEGAPLVFPGTGEHLYAVMRANVTLEDVTRVDFILFPFDESHPSGKETLMRNVPKYPDGDYVWDSVPLNLGLKALDDGDQVVMIAVAYKGTEIIGYKGQVTTVGRT